jgi:hypothetical protein
VPSTHLLVMASIATLAHCGCGSGTTRPFVMAHPAPMGDRCWNGALDTHDGFRWDVAFVPGIVPTAGVVADRWERAGRNIADTGRNERIDGIPRTAFRFVGTDVVRDLMVHGIRDDVVSTTHELGELWREAPFGWTHAWCTRWPPPPPGSGVPSRA